MKIINFLKKYLFFIMCVMLTIKHWFYPELTDVVYLSICFIINYSNLTSDYIKKEIDEIMIQINRIEEKKNETGR